MSKEFINEENGLWEKIRKFRFDDEGIALKFSQRLARENGWTISFAERTIEEYKRFIFLCASAGKMVTPSDQVDQAWHLHLTYTKSYWIDLCRNTVGKEIHHNPTKGGEEEDAKFNGCYAETFSLYRKFFGSDPPADIWPNSEERFSDTDFQRVNMRKYRVVPKKKFLRRSAWIVSLLVIAGVACIQAQNADDLVTALVVFLVIAGIGAFTSGNKGGGGGSACSSAAGCGTSCSSHSGCSSGCGSGCGGGGCGGGCGS